MKIDRQFIGLCLGVFVGGALFALIAAAPDPNVSHLPALSLNGKTNVISDNGTALTRDGVVIGTGGSFANAVSNSVASAGLLAVDATKTNGIAATLAHVTNAMGIFTGAAGSYVGGDAALHTVTSQQTNINATFIQQNQTNVQSANPTATVATTAVNGSATTFMRSDASPAIPASFITANQTNGNLASIGAQPTFNSLTNYSVYWTNFTVITENFANLTNWLQEGKGTNFVVSGNALHITGDTNTFLNYLSYTNYYTAADNWTMTCHAKFLTTNTSTSFGLGLGLRGANPLADNNVWIQYDTANGAMYLFNTWAGSTNAPTAVNGTVASETWPSGATNDFYYIELKKRGWTLTTTISNETSAAWQLYAHTFDSGSTNWGLMPYTAKPAIWAAGGGQVVSNFTFTVSGTFPCQLLMVGDSITQGYYTTAGNDTVFAKVKREVPSAGLLAAAADTTAMVLLRTNEINLFKPKNVVLNIGVNDIGFGVATATWQTNLVNLYGGITATGTKWVVRPNCISSADDSALADFVRLNWPANNIDLYNATKTNSTFRLRAIYAYTDGIHLSSTGQCVYADLVLSKVREGLK